MTRACCAREMMYHRGCDEGLRVAFFPGAHLFGAHGVAEHGIEINCFEPFGQLGRRLDV